ncbi:MFS transporter [Knoellia sp. p5-6-4]|uniref:MFS transporter n=1 Tax=unclassified Knoellia TaxID=2618719 RepID=UPI0023DC2D26|nr:MFS transporter [Knoellia sp. p5-6-4]MDF2144885.1 MFS transporter [Knoellia sp. p5-6-4]
MSLAPEQLLSRGTAQGRGALAAVTIGSGVAILDGTVVSIALPTIGRELDASLAQLQWVVNGYMLSLTGLILVGGALGDRAGRRRVYLVGVAWFALASLLCAAAQSPTQLIWARVLQGVGAALLTPGGLALIQGSFREEDRASAIGTWAGLSGIAAAAGPFVGGWLLDHGGWRSIFAVNLPLCALVLWLCRRYVPESRDEEAAGPFDVWGAALGATGLAALTYALTASGEQAGAATWLTGFVAVALLAAFVVRQARTASPLVPLGLFRSRVFSAANGMTFLVYGALAAVLFFLVIQLQVVSGFSPLLSGLASVPITVALLLLSSRLADLSSRIGPRLPMTVGPIVCAAGVLLLVPVGEGTEFWTGVMPGMTVFALGLAILVAPLTATVLAAAPNRYAGVASGVNNAVARAGSLLAVAALPPLVGLSGSDYTQPDALTAGYRTAQLVCAVLLTAGGVVSWVGLRGTHGREAAPAEGPPAGVGDGSGGQVDGRS